MTDFKYQLGDSQVFVQPKVWEGQQRVDIRYWWKPEGTQELKPTKKGVFLKLDDWEELKKSITVIDQMLHQTHPKPK